MSSLRTNVIYLSPGAGGMYCGSCLSDNMLARALPAAGCDVTLVPLYTPTLTDEPNVSLRRVFFGGLSVFLRQRVPLARYLPAAVTRLLDRPWLLRALGRRAVKTDASRLGALSVAMMRGERGPQRAEVFQLIRWLKSQPRPDVVNLGNLLIAGCVPALRRELTVPVVVTLQGDDVFVDALPNPYREEAMTELKRLAREVDAFIVHSRFYADRMAEYFDIPREKLHVVPLGLALDDFAALEHGSTVVRPPTVGYLARLCPAKGLHLLVEAFVRLRGMPGLGAARLRVAGWLGEADRSYFEAQRRRLAGAGHAEAMTYEGAVSRREKLEFLRGIDVLSVPTTFHEPKGRYVLEALAAGVPVVEPRHGAFPELLERLAGGELVEPGQPEALSAALAALLTDPARRRELGQRGRANVREHHSDHRAAEATLNVYREVIAKQRASPGRGDT